MPPASNAKANYKTYEAQARMVRAIVAAHPEVKWNYKEIAACYGSDMTDHALNHRFRKVRASTNIISIARAQGFDIKDLTTDENLLPSTQQAIDKNNIAKYFGQSTADGIQFQFRTIKKDAEALRQTANNGGDVAGCLSLGTGSGPAGPNTPSRATSARGQGSRSTKGSKRKPSLPIHPIKRSASDDEDEDDLNFDELDHTPSKRTKTIGRGVTPSRTAARKAAATIADASAQYPDSESPNEDAPTPTPTNASQFGFAGHGSHGSHHTGNATGNTGHAAAATATATFLPSTSVPSTSIFGDVERKPQTSNMATPRGLDVMASGRSGFAGSFTDPDDFLMPTPDEGFDWGDGEI
ncbi:hypothetical protein FLONG3_6197 [Fusarium longipes]|uniref:Uncharacterized protein n=1 Tax=Fusarium longipes TaxID=694270 RepID=A0A395SN25_9HYPO|nr:hypothetical protein FLONG3_6197 [Fusarium longipes]